MRLLISGLVAGSLVLGTCAEAAAFGRGASRGGGGGHPQSFSGGGHPQSFSRGGHYGVASGPFGGVHQPAYVAPRGGGVSYGGGFPHAAAIQPGGNFTHGVTVPHGGSVIHVGSGLPGDVAAHPWNGARSGGVIVGGTRGGGIGYPHTGFGSGGYRGGVAIGRNGWSGGSYGRGHYTGYYSPSALRDIGYGIRGMNYPYFTGDWYGRHSGVWLPPLWAEALGSGMPRRGIRWLPSSVSMRHRCRTITEIRS